MQLTTEAGSPAAPLGLGAREDGNAAGIARAVRQGVNFFFLYHLAGGRWATALADIAGRERLSVILATGGESRDREAMRHSLEVFLEALRTDYLDIFFAEYVRPDEEPDRIHGDGGVLAELQRWKEEGVIRYVGASAHDRVVSRRLAEDPRVDVLMQRYNMAHRAAADEVFPACRHNNVALVAFTATRWATLLAGNPGWPDDPPSAADCYRFCMAHPDVAVTLASPANATELEENLEVLGQAPMATHEIERWKRYGDLVYGDGTDSFETDWP